MPIDLILEQLLNGVQFGLMLFLLAAGLTLIFGVMDLINLAHGSLYMIGAYLTATFAPRVGFFPAVALAIVGTMLIGALLEMLIIRRLYARSHLTQVLSTFALMLIANEVVRMLWGAQPVALSAPEALSQPLQLPGFKYSAYRLFIIAAGLGVGAGLAYLVNRTRVGMWLRAGASNREMTRAMGVKIGPLYTLIFALGAGLCALAGALLGPLLSVQVGMGENILILAFVVVVIGGIGSIKGAFIGSLLVGILDTAGRAFLPGWLSALGNPQLAASLGPALASIAIYVLMAAVLFFKPRGLFPARGTA
ncbi:MULTISPECIES: branched-chain amino acid ABC transporter permease [Deinococcus]|uniref:Branched-chain amino acid ABC transporter permease n=1 Tax=Deinococcus cavernae TaxID=2320857 RepID=A0A418UZX5_9DEIO|nr:MULTISPECIES: branched-chain amino acid ABC transporter permease [Deinococcus]RJF69021.1 branched-chain amino acid ABC transporter permease [Deinococcus cavernae]